MVAILSKTGHSAGRNGFVCQPASTGLDGDGEIAPDGPRKRDGDDQP